MSCFCSYNFTSDFCFNGISLYSPCGCYYYNRRYTDTDVSYESEANDQPVINDRNLEIEQVVEGLELSTTMAFLGLNDILVLEKDKGTVQRIVSGNIN